jgi:hypothetical protein
VEKSSMAALHRLAVQVYCLRRCALPWSFFHNLIVFDLAQQCERSATLEQIPLAKTTGFLYSTSY